jgi:RNA polymerase sigma-70 factor (ECF subfamily)
MSLLTEQSAAILQRDDLLIEQLRVGNLEVFEAMYKNYRPKLTSFIRGIVPNEQAVDEVFDDVMMVVWKKIKDFEGRSKLSTWVYGIAYRRALKERGKHKDEVTTDEMPEPEANTIEAEKPFEAIRVKTRIQAALSNLPADQGSVVRLAYFEGMNYRDIGMVLDCPEDTVKTRMFHARRKLKKALGGSLADWV